MSWKNILKIDIDEARRLGDKYSPKDMEEEANETELHVEPETPTTPLKRKARVLRGLIRIALFIGKEYKDARMRGEVGRKAYEKELKLIIDLKN